MNLVGQQVWPTNEARRFSPQRFDLVCCRLRSAIYAAWDRASLA